MKRPFRTGIALAALALCPASFGTDLWLFFSYFSSHPTKPNAALGFVHALNNHGSYVYLSDTESPGLVLLMNVFLVGLFGTFALFPKEPTLAPPGTARWLTHFHVAKTDLNNPTPRQKAIFFMLNLVLHCRHLLGGPRDSPSHGLPWHCSVAVIFCVVPRYEFRASNLTPAFRPEYNRYMMFTFGI